jgi:RNA polymerase sigma-70 factor (ECF subfamily)
VDELVALLAADVLLAMPPIPVLYQGRQLVSQFLEAFVFAPGNTFRLAPVRANGQPALGVYLHNPADGVYHANGVMVFTLAGSDVGAMTRFDTSVLAAFGLPDTLPA